MTTLREILEAHADRNTSLQEASLHASNVSGNEAFCAALNLAIKRKKENAKPGTFVDLTPPINAYRYRAHLLRSPCGSPSALCSDVGALGNGTATLR